MVFSMCVCVCVCVCVWPLHYAERLVELTDGLDQSRWQVGARRHKTERWRRNMPSSLSSLRYPTTPSLPIGPSHPLSWCSLSIRWRRGADNGKHMRCHFAFVITGRVMRAGRFMMPLTLHTKLQEALSPVCFTHTHTHTHTAPSKTS